MRLRDFARSTPIAILALAAVFNISCSLPRVRPLVAHDFASGKTRVKRVAVLPVDLAVQVEGKDELVRSDARGSQEVMNGIYSSVASALRKRGYKVTAIVGPDGRKPRGKGLVIHPNDLSALRLEIHNGTAPYREGPGHIKVQVSSALTRQIQATTGADASLYARGWVYVARGDSPGATAAKVVGITLMALVVVGLVVMLAAGDGSAGKAFGGAGRAVGRALAGAGRAVVKTAATIGEVAVHALPAAIELAHATSHAHHGVPCHTCAPPPPPPPPLPPGSGRPELRDPPGMVGHYEADPHSGAVRHYKADPRSGAVRHYEADPRSGAARNHEADPRSGAARNHEADPRSGAGQASPTPTSRPAAPAPRVPGPARAASQPTRRPPPSRALDLHPGKAPARSTAKVAISLVHNKDGRVLWHAAKSFQVRVDKRFNMNRFVENFFAELPAAR